VTVTITETDDMSNHGRSSDRATVLNLSREPSIRVLKGFKKEKPQNWMEIGTDLLKHFEPGLEPIVLEIIYSLPAQVPGPMGGILFMFLLKITRDRDCSHDPLDHPSSGFEWNNSVSSDADVSTTSFAVSPQHAIHLLKHLLHDSILPEIIYPAFDLIISSAVERSHQFTKTRPISQRAVDNFRQIDA
jgi:hypothetical protein